MCFEILAQIQNTFILKTHSFWRVEIEARGDESKPHHNSSNRLIERAILVNIHGQILNPQNMRSSHYGNFSRIRVKSMNQVCRDTKMRSFVHVLGLVWSFNEFWGRSSQISIDFGLKLEAL